MKRLIMSFIVLTVLLGLNNGQVALLEDFENVDNSQLPKDWTEECIVGDNHWKTVFVYDNEGNPNPPYGGEYYVRFDAQRGNTTRLITPKIAIGEMSNPALKFYHTQPDRPLGTAQDFLKVYYKNSSDGEWKLLDAYFRSIEWWKEELISLPEKSDDYYIAFEGEGHFGNGIQLDDISVINHVGITDAEITSILTPKAGYRTNLTDNEEITAIVKNGGSLPISDFELKLELFKDA